MTAVGDDSEVIKINKAAGLSAEGQSDTFYVIKKGLFIRHIRANLT